MSKRTKKKQEKKAVADKEAKSVPLQKSPDVLVRSNTDGSLSLLNLHQYDAFYTIDGVASEFWKKIDGKKTAAELAAELQKKYPAQAAEVPKKVNAWIRDLKKFNLLV